MVDLTADKRKGMPQSQFGLSGKRFPMNDPTHQRLAIGGATRAERAGNISASTADRIKGEARRKLGEAPGGYVPNPQMDKPHMHALSMAAATHLHRAGHISGQQAEAIHAKSRQRMSQLAGAPAMGAQAPAAAPPAFGSLAPPMMGQPQGGQGGLV